MVISGRDCSQKVWSWKNNCDDIEYEIEGLGDKENQLRRLKGDLESNYADYIGKLRYVTEQQKGIIDELRNDISSLKSEIDALRRQEEQATAELRAESQPYARGRNTKNDAGLENAVNDFVGVHQEKRRVQEGGENMYGEWVEASRAFLDNANAELGVGQRDRGTIMRIQELMEQIFQSNQDIEQLLADLQRIDREKGISTHREAL